jgi:hypothetical protein
MSFNKPPITKNEKERKAEAFMNLIDDKNIIEKQEKQRTLIKEKTKAMLIRFPTSLIDDLKEVSALSGISINAICLELLRPSIKKKLKELEDYSK